MSATKVGSAKRIKKPKAGKKKKKEKPQENVEVFRHINLPGEVRKGGRQP